MRTAAKIEEAAKTKEIERESSEHVQEQVKKKRKLPDAIKPYQWVKGVSGNPGGRAKVDRAAELAREILEANPEAYYRGFAEQLSKGNAYAFGVLADRAFGKLKEIKEITHIHEDVADADLESRLKQLERDLGYADAIDQAGRAGIAQAGATETAVAKEDTSVLPR